MCSLNTVIRREFRRRKKILRLRRARILAQKKARRLAMAN